MGLFDRWFSTLVEPPKPKPPLFPFVPAMMENPTSRPPDNRGGGVLPLNPNWYPSRDTANALMQIFGALAVVVDDPKLVEYEAQPAYMLSFGRGCQLRDNSGAYVPVNVPFNVYAGLLAVRFLNNPEKDFADPVFGTLARRECWQLLMGEHANAVANAEREG